MERSRFNSLIQVDSSTWVAFNHTQGKILEVSPPVRRFLAGEPNARLTRRQREVLHERGFLVSSRRAELNNVRHRIYGLHYGRQKVGYSVVVTYACNLRCPYCYEEVQRPSRMTMSRPIAEQTVKHIIEEVRTSGAPGLALTLYGGEPLLTFDLVKFIVDGLEQGCHRLDVPFETYVITNGTLLTRKKVEALKPSLNFVQLTLEGSREHHNSIRVSASGEGTFSRILRSARLCLDEGVRVQFRIQLTPENWTGADDCLRELSERGFLRHPGVSVYFFPILDVSGVCSARSFACFEKYFSSEMLRALWDIALKYRANAFQPPRPIWEQPFCSFVAKHIWLVDPLGHKYKCVSLIGQEDAVAGSVTASEDGLARTRHLARELDLVERTGCNFEQCLDCALLPSCDGGCALRAQALNGSMATPSCEMHREAIPEQIAYFHRFMQATGAGDEIPKL